MTAFIKWAVLDTAVPQGVTEEEVQQVLDVADRWMSAQEELCSVRAEAMEEWDFHMGEELYV